MLESTGQWCTRNTSTRDTDVSPSVRFCQVFPHGDSGYVPFMRISHINPILSSAHDTDLSHSVQFSSVTQSCLPLCNPRDCSTPGLPVHHQLLEFTQTQVHWVGDTIQPSHPLSSPSPPASVLPMNIQDWFPLGLTGLISLQSKGLSRVFSNTTVQKHQFFGAQPSSQSNSHIHTWPLEKP